MFHHVRLTALSVQLLSEQVLVSVTGSSCWYCLSRVWIECKTMETGGVLWQLEENQRWSVEERGRERAALLE